MGHLVGVLALQGAFAKHIKMVQAAGGEAIEVRTPADLAACDALIIPGGESTTMKRQIDFIELEEPLKNFAKTKPIFGTCAGLILLSKQVLKDSMKPFGVLDISVERNAFGRQVESFQTDITVNLPKDKNHGYEAIFIRAPRIRRVSPEVTVLASFQGEPILVQQGRHLGATFHPELTQDPAIHRYFLSHI